MTTRADKQTASKLEAVAEYKQILRDIIDRRPSGTRHRLAQTLGKARSFISQITNPAYPVGIPADHLSLVFEVCHFSAEEKKRFLALYAIAHPARPVLLETLPRQRTVHLTVPDLGDPRKNEELDRMIHDFVECLAKAAGAAIPKGSATGRRK